MEISGINLPNIYVFPTASVRCFFFRPPNTRILLFCLKFGKDQGLQFESKTFPKIVFAL